MDYEKINPCAADWYVRAMEWAETGCWCCTATRAMLVGLWIGSGLTLSLSGHGFASFMALIGGAPVVVALLIIARRIWAESYKPDEESDQ